MYYYIYSFLSVYRIRLRRYKKKMNIPKECPIFLKKPVRWFEVATPPTALFTSGDRNPLLMIIGSSPSPYRLFHRLRNCSSQRHSRFKFSTCASFGTFSIPVFVLVNSRSEKCGVKREPSSLLEWPSAATLDEVKCSLRFSCLFISSFCLR